MDFSIREWLNLAVRWFHVFAGVMWVGQTYYFTWLDGQFTRTEKQGASTTAAPELWIVHSGGFYSVERRKRSESAPTRFAGFVGKSLMAWLAGMVLLVLAYYLGSGWIDPDVASVNRCGLRSASARWSEDGLFTMWRSCHPWADLRRHSQSLPWR